MITEPKEPGSSDLLQGVSRDARVKASGKSLSAFRTISEVSTDLDVPQHVLRFWESKFTQLRPLKRGGGRRYYRPEDVALLRRIHGLLYQEGYTIKGVQRVLRSPSRPEKDAVVAPPTSSAAQTSIPGMSTARANSSDALLRSLLGELKQLRAMLG